MGVLYLWTRTERFDCQLDFFLFVVRECKQPLGKECYYFASCELRVDSASCELILRVASCELRVSSCELRVSSFEFRVASCELRVASCELPNAKI